MVRRTTLRSSSEKERVDERLLLVFLFLLVGGLIMVYSNSSILAESRHGSQWFFMKSQFLWTILSLAAVYLITRLDIRNLAVYSVPALIIILVMLGIVFLMPARNASHRWILLAGLSIQPSEFFKLMMVIFLAFSLSNARRDITRWKQLIFPYAVLIGVGMMLIILQPDLGTAMVIGATALGMFFLAGARITHLAMLVLPMIMGGCALVFGLGYKKARVITWLDSVLDPLQGSYQVKQAALTLGSGGILGTGLGEGRQKLFFLPYPHTDFAFAAVGEELGLVGLFALLGAYFYLLKRGLAIAMDQPDRFGFLLASGLTLLLFVNIALNIAVVTAILPVTGLPLPFVSYGGSSLLISSAAVGLLLNLSRREVPAHA
jgi:cell division protein FtsW